jgi:hypothetical protein
MIDLQPVPVPDLREERVTTQRAELLNIISHRRRRPIKWAVLAGGAGVAATVSTLIVVGGSPPAPAFAGWSAVPSARATSQVSTANTTCEAQLSQRGPTNLGFDPSSAVSELTDVRGPFTVTVFADSAQNVALCMTTSGDNAAWQWIARSKAPVGASAIAVDRISSASQDGQTYTLIVGRAGSGVTGVSLVLTNGSDVTATTGNGLFVAWWPGTQGIASAAVTTTNGVSSSQTLVTQPSSGSQTVCLIRCGSQ